MRNHGFVIMRPAGEGIRRGRRWNCNATDRNTSVIEVVEALVCNTTTALSAVYKIKFHVSGS
jgi:NaMN:DMB phosphoribosyltransferase